MGKCKMEAKHAAKLAKEAVESKVKKMGEEVAMKKYESEHQLEKAQKVLVAAKMTAKEKEHEICDKARISSEMSNKHQTSFLLGLVKELKGKSKLCAAVHEDIGMVSGIDRATMLE